MTIIFAKPVAPLSFFLFLSPHVDCSLNEFERKPH